MPTEVNVAIEQRTSGELEPELWIVRRIVDLIQSNASGKELRLGAGAIESALRADAARLIDAE